MSYQVLARKWRPKTFHELMGQEHVVAVLTNALKQQRLHHAYLFTGTRGVGKTTIARIFAKSLNCELGITSEPCGKCDACLDIDQGRFVDLLEIDAASRTKVDDTREILDNVQYAPTRGRYKVYLIDEVHMLSRSSFNALLKTLEEPPEHVKFILATTDPQKLPVTVLSRCLQFHLKALSVPQIEQQLKLILKAEEVTFEELAVSLLAKAARGSMRDSLSLTDQAIAQGQGNLSASNIVQMLGGVDHNWVYKILIALIKQDSSALMALSLDIASYAPNYSRLMAELIQLLHQVAMSQIVDKHFDLSPEHNLLLNKFSQAMSAEDVQLYYQIVLNGRKDLPYAGDEQAAFDMVLLRLLAFKPQTVAVEQQPAQAEKSVDFDDVKLVELDNIKPADKAVLNVNSEVEVKDQDSFQREGEVKTETELNNEADEELITAQGLVQQQSEIEQLAELEVKADVEEQLTESRTAPESLPTTAEIQAHEAVEPSDKITSQVVSIEEDIVENIPFEANHQPQVDVPQVESKQVEAQQEVESNVEQANQVTEIVRESTNTETQASAPLSPIESILAGRNMLRSRKKALENDGKKSHDAKERQQPAPDKAAKSEASKIVEIPLISEQPYTADVIDPSLVKTASQVDKWANMIDAMALNGRLRQIALHATISPSSSPELLVLLLNQSTKHLKTDTAHQQLQQFVSEFFDKSMQVEIEIVEQTVDDPFQIQGEINDKRYDYAKELLLNDEVIIALQQDFQAEIDNNSIAAR